MVMKYKTAIIQSLTTTGVLCSYLSNIYAHKFKWNFRLFQVLHENALSLTSYYRRDHIFLHKSVFNILDKICIIDYFYTKESYKKCKYMLVLLFINIAQRPNSKFNVFIS